MDAFLGIDVADKTLAVHLRRGSKAQSKTFANTASGVKSLLKWLHQQGCPKSLRACMEATSIYHLLVAETLYEAGYTVYVANPYSVHEYAKSLLRRTKTDDVDAQLLAEYCQCQPRLHAWRPLPKELAELLALVRHRVKIRDTRAALRCQRSIARHPFVIESLDRQIAGLTEEIALAEKAITKHLKAHPVLAEKCRLLRSIPGIGPVTAPLLLAELGHPDRFANVHQLIAHAGLTPKALESGTSLHGQPRMCRIGSPRLRCALYMPGLVVFRCRSLSPGLIQRLAAEGKAPMTIIAALMHRVLRLAYGVLKSGVPYDPNYPESEKRTPDAAAA
jgi:transposase